MFDNITVGQILLMVIPLAAVQLGLTIFCLVKIHKEGVANLTKLVWTLIVLFVNLFGAIAFLLVGRNKDF